MYSHSILKGPSPATLRATPLQCRGNLNWNQEGSFEKVLSESVRKSIWEERKEGNWRKRREIKKGKAEEYIRTCDALIWPPDVAIRSLSNSWKNYCEKMSDRWTDRQTDKQTYRQTHRQTDRHTPRNKDTHINKDRHKYTQTDRQTHRQTDRQTNR
jgi:hypothetical protein